MKTLTLLATGFRILTLVGLLTHVYFVCSSFFTYGTQSSYTVENSYEGLSLDDQIPRLAVCIRYTDILGASDGEDASTQLASSDSAAKIQTQGRGLRVKRIFDETPDESESLAACYYRNEDGLNYLKFTNLAKCRVKFSLKRFFVADQMCYSYQSRSLTGFSASAAAVTLSYQSSLFGFQLSQRLRPANHTTFIVYFDQFPQTSRRHAYSIVRLAPKQAVEGVTLRFATTTLLLLPPPFDTRCSDAVTGCLSRCFAEAEKQMRHHFPSRILTRSDGKWPPVSLADLRKESVRDAISRGESACAARCPERECRLIYSTTLADHEWLPDSNFTAFYVHVMGPKFPAVRVRVSARIDLMSFLIYLCNCFNVWIGVDVWHLTRGSAAWVFIRCQRRSRCSRRQGKDVPANRRRATRLERRELLNARRIQLPWYCNGNTGGFALRSSRERRRWCEGTG